MARTNIIFLGMPGSGKGTISSILEYVCCNIEFIWSSKNCAPLYIISPKNGQKIPKITNLQYNKGRANYGTKKKSIYG